MTNDQAKQLVSSVLSNPYNEESFRGLVRHLFEDYASLDTGAISGAYIWEAFRGHVVSYKRIAKYKSGSKEIDVLAVCVQNGNKLEYARTMQRNFISRYLKEKERDAALVAFYSHGSSDWRLSLVKMDYDYNEEKQRLVTEFTPARRYSFLVGSNEQVHTACKQFLPVLTSGGNPTLADLEAIFNIETVSNEFFEKYKELFLRLAEAIDEIRSKDSGINTDFELNHITTQLFCKKLLGQIVFLYFLQKKGWLGVAKDQAWGTGDKRFLRSLFNKAASAGKNYFNDYLEHLFYEALAIKRPDSYFNLLGCRIPFLNGGLFEPIQGYDWAKFDIVIPNEIFSNQTRTSDGDIGDGVLDVFDRYNFTVREDEALEKEVAVDPEMLGKVFENLLEVKDRKSKGAFYTPREIVHYMCQESLIQYLYNKVSVPNETVSKQDLANFVRYGDMFREHERQADKGDSKSYAAKMSSIKKYAKEIDKALEDVLVCDPAIGSGAFPVGMMNEIVRARLSLLEYGYIKDGRVRNSYVYKRHAIQNSIYGTDLDSGAVEIAKLRFWLSLVVDEESVDDIKPLPNLDYKIMEANSLLRIQGNLFNTGLLKELDSLKVQFCDENDRSKKRSLKTKIDKILSDFTKDKGFDFEIFFHEVFSSNKGFDIVIGNPPYVQLQKLKKEKVTSGDNAGLSYSELYGKQGFETYEATGDLYCLFYEKGMSLLRESGVLCYITSNKWMRASYGEKLRAFFVKHNPLLLIDLGANVFSTATVDTNILLVEKKGYAQKTLACTLTDRTKDTSLFVQQKSQNMIYTKESWTILNPIEQSIKAKIEKYGTPLKDWNVNIYRGVLTGCNEAFIISGEKRAELIEQDPKSAEIIRPILRGRDIKRYGYDFADLWLICTFPSRNYNIDDYPAIKRWLLSFGKKLEQTGSEYIDSNGMVQKCRKKTSNKWFETQDSISYWNDFSKQKIAYREISDAMDATLIEGEVYLNNKCYMITGDTDLKPLLAYLNSSLFTKIVLQDANTTGGKGAGFLDKIYTPKFDSEQSSRLKSLTEEMLTPPNSRTSEQIDEIVCDAFNLTDEEILFIRG